MSRYLRILCFVFAVCSMFYYLLITRLLAEFTGDVILWSAVCSGVYLCSLGLGIFYSERSSADSLLPYVSWIELGLAVSGFLSMIVLYFWHIFYRIYMYDLGYVIDHGPVNSLLIFGGVAQLTLLVIGFLSGIEFGLVNRMGFRLGLAKVQILIAIYHFGGLLGTLILLLLLAPNFEPLYIGWGISLVNLAAAAVWAQQFGAQISRHRLQAAFGGALAVLLGVGMCAYRYDLVQLHRKNFYYNDYSWSMSPVGIMTYHFPWSLSKMIQKSKELPTIERHRGLYQNIDFIKDRPVGFDGIPDYAPEIADGWSMYMDGHFQVSSTFEGDYHETLAHIPTVMQNHLGRKVLIIGGGDGILVRELLRYGNDLDSITLIDIDPKILELARTHTDLKKHNKAAFFYPQVKTIAADAFGAMRSSKEIYDKIYVDVLFPFNFETSRLYSLEFFGLLAKHLAKDGHLAVLSPVDNDGVRDFVDQHILDIMASTIKQAGFNDLYLFAETRHTFMLALPAALSPPTAAQLSKSSFAKFIKDKRSFERITRVPLTLQPKLVNSILKPTFFGQRDTNF